MKAPKNIKTSLRNLIYCTGLFLLPVHFALAGQGVQRMLYTSPNTTFIEQPSGDSVVTVSDTSGSISTLQTSINNARSANPNSVIVIQLLANATYSVSTAGIVLGSHECLVASGATIKAASSSVTVPLITIASGSTNVSVAGGTLDASGANIQGIYAPAAARVNVDKVVVKNCGQDCILLKGNGNTAYDNEITVTRCDCSGSAAHAGISIQNSTQTAVLDNYCHNNLTGIWLSCAWADVANNVCTGNTTGIDVSGGDDNVVANNTCNNNGTAIHAGASNNMILSNSMGTNSTAGINSNGSGNNFIDNLFAGGNYTNFISAGSGDHVVAYRAPISASSVDYFYPPLINDQHTNLIMNGMGRTDLTIASTTIDNVQSQYNAALSANPNNVIVLHLNGSFIVGATALTLQSNSCVLLNGTIQINSSTAAGVAITGTNVSHVSVSGGVIDGGNLTGNGGISFSSCMMQQVDSVTLQNFGPDNPRVGNSDVLHYIAGATPQVITRCTINGGAARGIWLENSGVKRMVSDCQVTAVNMDGVDCDASTSGSVVKFNYLHDLVRYGVFFEQSAANDVALGNICNNDGRDINIYNNSTTPRSATEYNSVLCNWCESNNGIRNGSTGTNVVQSSHNFLFDNTILNADIESQTYGTQNYYSQNYLAGGALSTAGVEAFFNSTDVSSNSYVQDSNSGLSLLVSGASTANGAQVVIGQPSGLGNDQWALIPTDSGYYRITNLKSKSVMAVQSASLSVGAKIVQWTFGSSTNDQWMPTSAGNGLYYFVNRLSGLCLDVPGVASGTQLDQQVYNGGANQQFSLLSTIPAIYPFAMGVSPNSQTVIAGDTNTFVLTISTNSVFSGSVNFSLSGLPTNTTANFSPATLSGNGTSTLTITTTTNAPVGTYALTVTGTGSSMTNTAYVSFTVNSGIIASPGTLLWTGTNNWSVPQNWTNLTSGGYGPPGISNDVIFTNIATVTTSNTVNNIVNSDVTINSLTFNNTNGFHTTQIVPGSTLTTSGSKGLLVGAELDLGGTAAVYDTITGAGGMLVCSNSSASLIVRQGAVSGGSQRATLDLSGLDTFSATLNQIYVGVAGPVARSTGTLALAKTNSITASGSIGIVVADNNGNGGGQNYFYLGQNNSIYADSITIAREKCSGSLLFNPAFTNASPELYLRGVASNRVSALIIGDNSPQSVSGSSSTGTMDLSGGTVDIMANTMFVGRGQTSNGTGTATGILTLNAGILDVNTLDAGYQNSSSAAAAVTGTVNVNGSATLLVNSMLRLARYTGGGTLSVGTLNVNGGTISGSGNIVAGGGASTLSINGGTLNIDGTVGAVGAPIGKVTLTNASLQFSVNSVNTAATNLVASSFVTGGSSNLINITLLPPVSTPAQITLIDYANSIGGAGFNFVLSTPVAGGGFNAYLSNNIVNSSVDLVFVSSPTAPPAFAAVSTTSGTNFLFNVTNGIPNWPCYILGTTNLTLPLSQWPCVATNVFDSNGNFTFTNSYQTTSPQQFYLLQVP